MTSQQEPSLTPVDVQVSEDETPDIAEYAEQRVRELIEDSRVPVLHARVRITRHGNPARSRPVVAQANLDVNGRMVRAQFRARTAYEAVDLLRDRLRRRLRSALQQPGDVAALGTWREPGEDPQVEDAGEDVALPREERKIVREKTVGLLRQEVTDAAAFMGDMGYDFHLFVEASTGQDSVLYRSGSSGYRLATLRGRVDGLALPPGVPVTLSDQGAARLSVGEAVERMGVWTQPFLFFENSENDRGALLYLRHDGHYGLVCPAE